MADATPLPSNGRAVRRHDGSCSDVHRGQRSERGSLAVNLRYRRPEGSSDDAIVVVHVPGADSPVRSSRRSQ